MNYRTHYEPTTEARRSMRRFEAIATALQGGAACLLLYAALVAVMSF